MIDKVMQLLYIYTILFHIEINIVINLCIKLYANMISFKVDAFPHLTN